MSEETWDENGVPADVLRQNLKATRARVAALEAEIASLTPSGDVADDAYAIQRALVAADRFLAPEVNADVERAAPSRLTAKAQAYDGAMADNAALLGIVREQIAVACEDVVRQCGECASCAARAIVDAVHPGAALLEQHRKALEARDDANAGLLASLRSERDQHSETMAAAARRHETTRATMHVREEATRKALEPLQAVVTGLAEAMEAAIRERERPRGGQQVSFHGDFAQVPPRVVGQLRWWARELREALAGNPARLLVRARNDGIERVALRFVENDMAATAEEIRALREPES